MSERHSCDALGVCQGRVPACSICRHPFAPGVIDRAEPRPRVWTRSLLLALALVAVAGAVGLAVVWLPANAGLLR